jgi:hypothetical protein
MSVFAYVVDSDANDLSRLSPHIFQYFPSRTKEDQLTALWTFDGKLRKRSQARRGSVQVAIQRQTGDRTEIFSGGRQAIKISRINDVEKLL